MSDLFTIIEVPEDATQETESLGTKFKFWYRNDKLDYLYKQARPNTGEAWSEKIASELCQLLNLAHADYELAIWNGNLGTISPSFVPPNKTLGVGLQFCLLLAFRFDDFLFVFGQLGLGKFGTTAHSFAFLFYSFSKLSSSSSL